jgi:hypothetical protein
LDHHPALTIFIFEEVWVSHHWSLVESWFADLPAWVMYDHIPHTIAEHWVAGRAGSRRHPANLF